MKIKKKTSELYHYTFSLLHGWLVWFMVFNATFNNISAILWQSVLLVEETGVPGENIRPAARVRHWLYHIMLHRVHITMNGAQTHNFSTDSTGICKSNYHTLTATMVPVFLYYLYTCPIMYANNNKNLKLSTLYRRQIWT